MSSHFLIRSLDRGAVAFVIVIAALAVLILGEETKGRTLEHISH